MGCSTHDSLGTVIDAPQFANIILPKLFNPPFQVLCLFPFAAYQWFAYTAFCRLGLADMDLSEEVTNYGKKHGLKMPGHPDKPDWCRNDPPVSYFSVHSMNWPSSDENSTKGIDILIYSTIGQLPYFISSAPSLGKKPKQ